MTTNAVRRVVVEVMLLDGSLMMYVGRLIGRTKNKIRLVDAAWVANTGRRHLFFAGTPDSQCEVEPYADGQEVEVPGEHAILTQWPYPLLREAK